MPNPPTPVVTCTVYHKDKFLVIRRHDASKKFGGLWAFPGGKVEVGETITGAIRREIKEETGLDLTDRALLLDTYFYGTSIGLHFAVFTEQSAVTPEPGIEYKWLDDLAALQALPRIPGIDYHITEATRRMTAGPEYLSLDALDYTPDKYIN